MSALRVAVVGAGIAGLTAAHAIRRRAAEAGRSVELTLLDAGTRVGGQLQTVAEDGYRVEWAANAFRTGKGPTADLVARLGLEGERVVASPAANRRFVFHGGRLHALPSGPASLLRFAPMSPAGRWRVLAEPFVARRVAHEESVHDYAARHIGREAAELLLGTMVRGVYGGDARALSVDAAFPVMREMERDHRSLVIAGIAGGAASARLEGKATWSFRGGMGVLMERSRRTSATPCAPGPDGDGGRAGDGDRGYRLRVAGGERARRRRAGPRRAAGGGGAWLRPLDAALADEVAASSPPTSPWPRSPSRARRSRAARRLRLPGRAGRAARRARRAVRVEHLPRPRARGPRAGARDHGRRRPRRRRAAQRRRADRHRARRDRPRRRPARRARAPWVHRSRRDPAVPAGAPGARRAHRAAARSEALFARSRERFPGGVNSPVRAFGAVGGTPRFVARADGPRTCGTPTAGATSTWSAPGAR
jgi:hypothetical protein